MPKFIDLTGKTFTNWTVLRRLPTRKTRVAKVTMWLCKCLCGNEKAVARGHLLNGHSTSCGCLHKEMMRNRKGENSWNWKGGKTTRNGYVHVLIPIVERETGSMYAKEHRIIMENYLGRKLLTDETVHHKNGIRSDNRIENLELWSKSHPYGQRVEDKVKWAIEMLKLYNPSYLSQNAP